MPATQRTTAVASETTAAPIKLDGARGRYARIPNEILDDRTLSARARDLWCLIRRRDWQGEGWVFTHAELARAAGCCVATLTTTLALLEARGLVRMEGTAKRPKRYFALRPALPGGDGGGGDEGVEAGGWIAKNEGSDPQELAIQSLPISDPITTDYRSTPEVPYIDQKRSKTNQSAAAQQGIMPSSPPPREDLAGDPHMVTADAVARLVIEAQGRPIVRAAVARLVPSARAEVITAYQGRVTLPQIAACLAYMRGKPYFAGMPQRLTPQRLGEDLGPWLQAGQPAVYAPPAGAAPPRGGFTREVPTLTPHQVEREAFRAQRRVRQVEEIRARHRAQDAAAAAVVATEAPAWKA